MSFYPRAFSRDETAIWIERMGRIRYETDGHGLWAMTLRDSGELIGDCGLVTQKVDGERLVEVGWHTRKDLWGRGYAPEAGLACRDHGFASLGLERLISLIQPSHRSSRRVAEKLGMSVWKEAAFGSEGLLHCVYSLTRPEWAAPDT